MKYGSPPLVSYADILCRNAKFFTRGCLKFSLSTAMPLSLKSAQSAEGQGMFVYVTVHRPSKK